MSRVNESTYAGTFGWLSARSVRHSLSKSSTALNPPFEAPADAPAPRSVRVFTATSAPSPRRARYVTALEPAPRRSMSSYESPVVGWTSADPTRASDDEARRSRRARDDVEPRRRVGRIVDDGRRRVAMALGRDAKWGRDARRRRRQTLYPTRNSVQKEKSHYPRASAALAYRPPATVR